MANILYDRKTTQHNIHFGLKNHSQCIKPDVSFYIFSRLDFLKTYIFTAPDATLHVSGLGDLEVCIQTLGAAFKRLYSHQWAERHVLAFLVSVLVLRRSLNLHLGN